MLVGLFGHAVRRVAIRIAGRAGALFGRYRLWFVRLTARVFGHGFPGCLDMELRT